MIAKLLIVLGIYALIGFSGYELYVMLHQHQGDLQTQNIAKFQCLFCIHIFVAILIFVLLKLENFYHQILCAFFIFLVVFVAIFICEATSKADAPEQELINQKENQGFSLEKTYHDIYYLIYMYSIMGLTLTGMFIFVSEGMAYWQGPPVSRYDGIIEFLDYNDSMQDTECPICLAEYTKEGKYWRIKKCSHIFHQDCLKQWLKYNKICPLDRANIMQSV